MTPRIVLFGDSHSYAIQRALERRIIKDLPQPVTAYRLLKMKNGKRLGDTSFEAFLKIISQLGPEDVVLSAIGGNQHAVFSTIQHAIPFDFFEPGKTYPTNTSVALIPYRAVENMFLHGIRNGDGMSIRAVRQATQGCVVHIIPPPPKANNAFIRQHHETVFAREGIEALGVSSPELRMKFWRLQTRILTDLCNEINVEVMPPPRIALDDAGFLAPDFYASDATHANADYGELLLREVEKRYLEPAARAEAE